MIRHTIRAGRLAAALALIVVALPAANACDVCAVYTGTELHESRIGPIGGIGQQFTRFTTLKVGDEEIDNPRSERLESSISQVLLGYGFSPGWAVNLSLPIVHRTFRRVGDQDGIDRGSESGIGDLSLLARYTAFTRANETSIVRLSVFGGIELPTGDTGRLREELHHDEDDEHHEEEREPDGHHDGSGIHGHDLALGSGSVDGLFGGQIFASWKRAFFSAFVQYGLRTEGDFDYDYANELSWSGGPGSFLVAEPDRLIGLQARFSGETKGKDTLNGERADDTAITALYVGPGLQLTWRSSLAAEIFGELPILQNATSLQIVPDFRIRGGLTWRF